MAESAQSKIQIISLNRGFIVSIQFIELYEFYTLAKPKLYYIKAFNEYHVRDSSGNLFLSASAKKIGTDSPTGAPKEFLKNKQ